MIRFRCSDAHRSSRTHRTGPSRFFCCCSIHQELSTCWHSTVRKHSHFQTPLENPSIQTHLVLLCCIKRLCIFGPKGAIQICYYYYYNVQSSLMDTRIKISPEIRIQILDNFWLKQQNLSMVGCVWSCWKCALCFQLSFSKPVICVCYLVKRKFNSLKRNI